MASPLARGGIGGRGARLKGAHRSDSSVHENGRNFEDRRKVKVNLEISLDLEEPRGDRNSKNSREEKERESFIDPNTR